MSCENKHKVLNDINDDSKSEDIENEVISRLLNSFSSRNKSNKKRLVRDNNIELK